MKMRLIITGEYDVTDDPAERAEIYGSADPHECAKVDAESSAEDLLSLADRIVSREVRPILPGVEIESAEDFARWIVSLDDPDGPGFEARKAVSMNQIITKAREALALPDED